MRKYFQIRALNYREFLDEVKNEGHPNSKKIQEALQIIKTAVEQYRWYDDR